MGTIYTDQVGLPAPDGADLVRNGDNQIRALAAALDARVFDAGDLKATARSTASPGWLMCDGAAVSRATYADLFAAIGTTYGAGNGSTTFNLPDFRGRTAVGPDGTAGRLASNDALGQSGGSATHTLAPNELPAHDHNVADPGHSHGYKGVGPGAAGLNDSAGSPSDFYTPLNTFSATTGITVDDTGKTRGSAHNNMPPYQVCNWMVKT